MSKLREEFEAWARSPDHDLCIKRLDNNSRYESLETEWAFRAWQASQSAGQERGEAVAWYDDRFDFDNVYWGKEPPNEVGDWHPLYAAPTDAQSRIADFIDEAAATVPADTMLKARAEQAEEELRHADKRIAELEAQLEAMRAVHDLTCDAVMDLEAQLTESREREGRLAERLVAIGDYAHDRSTGPAVWDPLWEIRSMAYEGADIAAEKEQK